MSLPLVGFPICSRGHGLEPTPGCHRLIRPKRASRACIRGRLRDSVLHEKRKIQWTTLFVAKLWLSFFHERRHAFRLIFGGEQCMEDPFLK